jgi:hypothetical protein
MAPEFDPMHPPTRIYVSGYTYKIVAPHFPRPPLLNTVKAVLNWAGPASTFAKNIFYHLFPTGVDTTVPSFLTDVANNIMTQWAASAFMTNLSNGWTLTSCTVTDNGSGSGARGTSTHAVIPGGSASTALSPQVAIVISWPIASSYRGGKPRWYLPGATVTTPATPGSPAILVSVANAIQTAATAFRSNINASVVDTFTPVLGTISYQTGHAARPTPVFRPFLPPRIHERLDSQRRRNGKESGFAVVP